jgi:acetyl esterase/lipase
VVAAGLSLLTGVSAVLVGATPAGAAGTRVSYGGSPDQTITVYSAAATSSPLVVLVHGGGWTSKPGEGLPTEAAELQAAGFAVFDVNYDTLSRSTGAFPLEIDDVEAATEWAIAHAGSYRADPANVEMVGGSSGGQLVGMAAEALNDHRAGTVRSMVTLSGALDFVRKVRDIRNGIVRGYLATHTQEALACSLKRGTCTRSVEVEWSPAEGVTAANCPSASLVINSNREPEPVDQANSMTSALRKAHCGVTEVIRDGTQHSFAYWPSVAPQVIGFLAVH